MQVEADDATLRVTMQYVIRRTQTRQTAEFARGGLGRMIYFCCDQLRRNQLVGSAFNGIDYLEVLDHEIEISDPANRQKKLVVHFINDLAANALERSAIFRSKAASAFATSSRSTRRVDGADAQGAERASSIKYGDFSIYTLRLVQNAQNAAPPDDIDPLFAAVDFSFKVDCPTDFDCQPRCDCPPAPRRGAGDRLSRQGLRELSPADARPHVGC